MQPQVISVIPSCSLSQASSWTLTMSGTFTNTQTVVIAGITFTSVSSIGTTAGNFLIGGDTETTLASLAALINDPTTTSATQVALSAENVAKLQALGISATSTATTLVLTSSVVKPGGNNSIVVSETQTNGVWTTNTTSAGFSPTLGNGASLQFVASSISSGNGVFTVEVSNDGSNWVAYNKLTTNVTNTNGQTDTRVASVTLNANTSSVVSIPEVFAFYRVKVAVSVDGVYSATAFIS